MLIGRGEGLQRIAHRKWRSAQRLRRVGGEAILAAPLPDLIVNHSWQTELKVNWHLSLRYLSYSTRKTFTDIINDYFGPSLSAIAFTRRSRSDSSPPLPDLRLRLLRCPATTKHTSSCPHFPRSAPTPSDSWHFASVLSGWGRVVVFFEQPDCCPPNQIPMAGVTVASCVRLYMCTIPRRRL